MPVYNNQRFLEKSVKSVLSQDFSDYELILVDDGSTDESGALVDRIAQQDARIRAVHQKNQGPAAARNHGIRLSKGEYLLFLDSDDEYEPGVLSYLAATLSQTRYDVLCFGYDIFKTVNGVLKKEKSVVLDKMREYKSRDEIEQSILEIIDLRILFSSTCTKAYNAGLVRKHGLVMPESIRIGEDYCFNLQVLRAASSYCFCDRVFYRYISQNESSIITSFHADKFEQLLVVHRQRKEFLHEVKSVWNQELEASVQMDYIRMCFSCFMDLFAPACPFRHAEKIRYISEKKGTLPYTYSKGLRAFYGGKQKIVYSVFATQNTFLLFLCSWAFYMLKFVFKRSID